MKKTLQTFKYVHSTGLQEYKPHVKLERTFLNLKDGIKSWDTIQTNVN